MDFKRRKVMKKFSIILTVLLLVSIVLSGCGETKAYYEKLSLFDVTAIPQNDTYSIKSDVGFSISGSIEDYSKDLIITKEQKAEENLSLTYTYRVYNTSSKKQVFTISYSSEGAGANSIVGVRIIPNGKSWNDSESTLPDDCFAVYISYHNGKSSVELYAVDGLRLAGHKYDGAANDFSVYKHVRNYVRLGDNLYYIANGQITLLCNVYLTGLEDVLENADGYFINGSYYMYLKNDGGKLERIQVYDANFELQSSIKIDNLISSYNASTKYYVLSNGNVILTTTRTTYTDKYFGKEGYDFKIADKLIDIDTVLVDVASGEVEKIADFPLYQYSVTPVKYYAETGEADGSALGEGQENIICGYEIVDGRCIETKKAYFIDNNGKITAEYVGLNGEPTMDYSFRGGYYLIDTDEGRASYNENGVKVSALPSYDAGEYNDKWFEYGNALYTWDGQLACDFGEKCKVVGWTDNSVLLVSEDSENGTVTYKVYNGEAKAILASVDPRFVNLQAYGNYIIATSHKYEGNEDTCTYTVFDTNGQKIREYAENFADGEYLDYTLYTTENSIYVLRKTIVDGDLAYFVETHKVFKNQSSQG